MILVRVVHEFTCDGVLVNVIPMVREVLGIANPMIGESALPYF